MIQGAKIAEKVVPKSDLIAARVVGNSRQNAKKLTSQTPTPKGSAAQSAEQVREASVAKPEGGKVQQIVGLRSVKDTAVTDSKERLLWSSWRHYPKITVGGREYAKIGDRLYSHHAIDRMLPSNFANRTLCTSRISRNDNGSPSLSRRKPCSSAAT